MKIGIIGLGLIGASYAQGLKLKKYEIYGFDIDKDVVFAAKKDKIIVDKIDLNKPFLNFDLLILSLYPNENVDFIKKYQHLINKRTIITDVSGTKTKMLKEIKEVIDKDLIYVSHHPMAGKEVSGYYNKDYKMFKKANFIIINGDIKGVNLLKIIAKDLEFGNVLVVSKEEHDKLIAHTSQLTHLIALGLINMNSSNLIKQATGDSFRDLTRIAKINEVMWTELFIDNKEILINTIEQFKLELDMIKELIKEEKIDELYNYLIKARERRVFFEED